MFTPLNPTLYRLLEREFEHVLVSAEGEAMQGTYDYDNSRDIVAFSRPAPIGPSTFGGKIATRRRPSLKINHSGEEYRVNCPFCNDTRHRLFINHRWGVEDKYGNRNLWLAHCWNEECLSSHLTQKQLWAQVYRARQRPPTGRELRAGRLVDLNNLGKAVPPGPIILLSDLRRTNPQHAAIEYLERRGFDCDSLAELFGVGYCADSRYPLAANRIYVPIRMDGELRGWQMRMTRDWRKGDAPKYWSMPNMKRRLLAYNYDRAVEYKVPVIVEGPADVWSYGLQALGCIGKTMNPAMMQRLAARSDRKCVVVMLDPAPDATAKQKLGDRYVHHIEKLAEALEKKFGYKRAVRVYLPDGSDPGGSDPEFMRDYIAQAAREQGARMSFKKRKGT